MLPIHGFLATDIGGGRLVVESQWLPPIPLSAHGRRAINVGFRPAVPESGPTANHPSQQLAQATPIGQLPQGQALTGH
jgi:hypothetical protein